MEIKFGNYRLTFEFDPDSRGVHGGLWVDEEADIRPVIQFHFAPFDFDSRLPLRERVCVKRGW